MQLRTSKQVNFRILAERPLGQAPGNLLEIASEQATFPGTMHGPPKRADGQTKIAKLRS